MAAQPDTAYQFNFKLADGSLHNIYAANGSEAIELLGFFETDILPALTSVAQKIGGASVVAASIPVAPAATQTVTAPPPAATPDAGSAPLCAHGQPAKLIQGGISKSTGKPYRAFYACNQPRNAQCDFRATA